MVTKRATARKRPARRVGGPRSGERASRILAGLREAYPDADCELAFRNPFQLLIATILSAQTTDKAVNSVTPQLFRSFPSAARLARAEPSEIEPLISRIGLFRNKAKAIVGAARLIVERFDGAVPGERGALESLPGVGRKTANVVLPNAFGVPGLAVDTHVSRVSGRLGLTRETDPKRIESDLTSVYDESDWCFVSHALIWHGRRICSARKPVCAECSLERLCPSSEIEARHGVDARRNAGASSGRGATDKGKKR